MSICRYHNHTSECPEMLPLIILKLLLLFPNTPISVVQATTLTYPSALTCLVNVRFTYCLVFPFPALCCSLYVA